MVYNDDRSYIYVFIFYKYKKHNKYQIGKVLLKKNVQLIIIIKHLSLD